MWKLLKSPADWDAYKTEMTLQRGLQQNLMNWGSGPQKYPCLIDGLLTSTTRVTTCYVYPEDIGPLVGAAGYTLVSQDIVVGKQAAQPQATAVPDHTWKDFANSVSAHLLAQSHFLCETAICSREQYEAVYNQMLARVDQWTTEDRENALAKLTGNFPLPEQS